MRGTGGLGFRAEEGLHAPAQVRTFPGPQAISPRHRPVIADETEERHRIEGLIEKTIDISQVDINEAITIIVIVDSDLGHIILWGVKNSERLLRNRVKHQGRNVTLAERGRVIITDL